LPSSVQNASVHSFRLIALLPLLAAGLAIAQPGPASKEDKQEVPTTIAEKTKGLTVRAGLIESYLDAAKGKVFLKFPAADPKTGFSGSYIYVESLTTGLGSNDLGIDRSQFGDTLVVNVRPIADKVFFEVPNLNFRADTDNPDELRAVAENFAKSIYWAGPVAARDADGSMLVDVTDLLLRDVHHVGRTLQNDGYSLDKDRSTVLPEKCKAFPDNLEMEALLTFHTDKGGGAAGGHAAEPQDITLTQHQSFVRLPDAGYQPRAFDPRCGAFDIQYLDFSQPLGQPLVKQFITRHRLAKTDPTAARSTVKNPIIYYVDRGVPEPIRSALIEGGNYWRKAFDAAGFIDAYRVEEMPADVDPMDVRYNVVQWMDRSTRGYAYGQSVIDPRTGEILKGAVNLDSQRARQDILVLESLVGVKGTGKGGPNDPIQVALARVRQLAAHEIGHTLGFQHNFAASTRDRSSVMDYPAPRIRVTPSGDLDFSQAYAPGIGIWDMQLVKYAYTQFPAGTDEKKALNDVVEDGLKQNLVFLSDNDATESFGASPYTNRWDDMPDPIADLKNSIHIRSIGLSHFGEGNLRVGQPLTNLEMVFGPLYMFHRYDANSAAKMVGGLVYRHNVNGDSQPLQSPIPAAKQREALSALLGCLKPSFLNVPPNISRLMGPHANSDSGYGERFVGSTPFAFDTISAASAAADVVLQPLLDPGRCSRIVEWSSRDTSLPSLDEVLATSCNAVVVRPSGTAMEKEINWAVQHAFVARLISLADAGSATPTVRARARRFLISVSGTELALSKEDETGNAALIASEIKAYLSRPVQPSKLPAGAPDALPGAPIGMFQCDGP
jgi:hypothetical protein